MTAVRPEIVMTGPMAPDLAAQLDAAFTVLKPWLAPDPVAFLRQYCSGVRGVATRSVIGADATLMRALPGLEIISTFGVGTEKVDLAAAAARGIRVTNTPDVLTADTADFAMALVLALSRRVAEGDQFVRSGRWSAGPLAPGRRVNGATMGIVGMGRIGQVLARRAAGFDMDVCWYGPSPKPFLPYRYEPDLLALAQKADILVLTCPGGAATDRLINRSVLDALGPRGTLVNIARASVVDEPEVIAALRDHRIAGAAFDVFSSEPGLPEAFLGLDNVVLAPHAASRTTETQDAIGNLMLSNLKAYFAGEALPSEVLVNR